MSDEAREEIGRVLVVYQDNQPNDIIDTVRPYARHVVAIDIGSDAATRALTDRVDCVVFDWRVTDLTGVGIIFATRFGQLIPQLIMHDDRPGWEPQYMRAHLGARDMLIDMSGSADLHTVVTAFMHRIGAQR